MSIKNRKYIPTILFLKLKIIFNLLNILLTPLAICTRKGKKSNTNFILLEIVSTSKFKSNNHF